MFTKFAVRCVVMKTMPPNEDEDIRIEMRLHFALNDVAAVVETAKTAEDRKMIADSLNPIMKLLEPIND